MGKRGGARFFLATSALALASAAQAGETVTYSYDALGRLVATSSSGTVNNGLTTQLGYDPAGNRSTYTVATSGGGAPPPSGPVPPPSGPVPPPPPSGNQPPVAGPDTGGTTMCAAAYFNVLANDYDPDGNTPLTLLTATSNGIRGDASVGNNMVYFAPNGVTGAAIVTYTIRDSLGATASGTLSLTISKGNCVPL